MNARRTDTRDMVRAEKKGRGRGSEGGRERKGKRKGRRKRKEGEEKGKRKEGEEGIRRKREEEGIEKTKGGGRGREGNVFHFFRFLEARWYHGQCKQMRCPSKTEYLERSDAMFVLKNTKGEGSLQFRGSGAAKQCTQS